MTNLWIWNELEIEPTNDRRAIKRAYAKKSRLCHPEEKPEEFRRLHEAYRMALELAERQEGGKEWGERPGAALPAHAPAPDYRQLDELIARGLEQDYARDTKLLLEKMKRLHQEAGENVDRYTGQMETCLEQWRRLTDSEHFRTAGWKPEFLEMLSDWLRENRDSINRAEAIILYNAYDFIHYLDRDFPDVPFINEVYIQLMYQARKYERDMLQYSGLPVGGRVKGRSRQQCAGKTGIGRRNLLYCLMWAVLFFCLMMVVMFFIPGKARKTEEQAEPMRYSAVHEAKAEYSAEGNNQFRPAPGFEDALWVSHVVCGPEKSEGTVLYPGCARFDVTKELLDHLESLDWMVKMNYNESNRQTIIKENEQ